MHISPILMATAPEISAFADNLLSTREVPDYPNALNGLQIDAEGPVTGIAAAVDFSTRSVGGALEKDANFLILHHGAFWNSPERMIGARYRLFRTVFERKVAVYSSHIPLDCHPTLGNNVQLAKHFGLTPDGKFCRYKEIQIGVTGETTVSIADLLERVRVFAAMNGGQIRHTPFDANRITGRWAICSGAGADSNSLQEAKERGVGVLIVGEGAHHTAVAAEEDGLVVIYAGHYATETPGVQALAEKLSQQFHVPWHFIPTPTGT
jgi:dinuclear metal center YbgI/SA1388 family protein